MEELLKENRRSGRDRRREPTRPFSRYMVFGRRRRVQRKGEKRNHLYVDRYDHPVLLVLLLVVLLSVLDGYLTIFHVERGAQEINPIMNFLLGYGDDCFFILKYVLTAIGVIIFCIFKNLLFVRIILACIIVFYVGILANHLVLMFMR
jgi:hypothetical protein